MDDVEHHMALKAFMGAAATAVVSFAVLLWEFHAGLVVLGTIGLIIAAILGVVLVRDASPKPE